MELRYFKDSHSLSSCYRKADMREFDWVSPFETIKWDFHLSTIGFFFFFLLQIWFLWKWGINTTDPSSVRINLSLYFPTKTFNSCYTLQPGDCCYFNLQHLFSAGRRQICQRCCNDRGPSSRRCTGTRAERMTEEASWWGTGVEKDRAEHGARGWECTGGTLGFSITQINPLTLSLATTASQQRNRVKDFSH